MNRIMRDARRRRGSWLKRQLSQKPLPAWVVIATDSLLIGVGLVVFALFHHVLPHREASTGIVSNRFQAQETAAAVADEAVADETSTLLQDALPAPDSQTAEAPDAATAELSVQSGGDDTAKAADEAESPLPSAEAAAPETATAAPEAEAEVEPMGYFGNRFSDKFTDGRIVKTSNSYQSGYVNITLHEYEYEKSTFYYADIYIKDIECFRTAFAEGRFGRGLSELPATINHREGGILAVNGDYYGARSNGVVIRNGELYRDKNLSMDVCVLYWDGTMEVYGRKQFNAREAMEKGAYQAWHFGPNLLDEDGNPLKRFSDGSLGPNNPRTVLGYYEPGHYCFVVVDGRSSQSSGLTIKVLARLMSKLGCKRAYNLDGGNSSFMVIDDKVVNNPSGGGRASSDIVMIVDK